MALNKNQGTQQIAIAITSAGLAFIVTSCDLNKRAAGYETKYDILKTAINDYLSDPTLDDKFLAEAIKRSDDAYMKKLD